MRIGDRSYRTIWELSDASGVEVIDQRHLPHRFVTATLRTATDVVAAIRDMWVRGAPLIGAAAGYGLYLAARTAADSDVSEAVGRAIIDLAAARPTAVNLRWALQFAELQVQGITDPDAVRSGLLKAARRIVEDEVERSRRIGLLGCPLIQALSVRRKPVRILTHCNAGWLACVDYGTATAPIYAAYDSGTAVHVWVDETRPRNQGASLTAFELGEHGVPHTVIADNAGGHLMQAGLVDLVIVGADRVAANGDTANKIGTYLKALAARDCNVPFYVAIPSSTFDPVTPNGSAIPIEERSPDEVRYVDGLGPTGPARVLVTPASSSAFNPAFDVTPARLITGFITEKGVFTADQLSKGITAP